MKTGDWITLAGVLVAAAAIATPPILHHRTERHRQRARFRSRIESFSTLAYVVLTQQIDMARGTLTDPNPEFDQAMLVQLRAGAADLAAAIDDGADEFTAELRSGASGTDEAERRVATWYQMLADLRISLTRPNTKRGDLAGVAALSYCCASIALRSVEEVRDEAHVRDIITITAGLPGIGARIDHYARTLAPALVSAPGGSGPI